MLAAQNDRPRPVVEIPRVSKPPALEDFLEMKPSAEWEGKLAKVEGFIQRLPSDGAPSTQRTEVYLGYDDENLYTLFVCFDSEPNKVRARHAPRDILYGDERVDLFLDTFNDQRRAYVFTVNPFGYQMDGLWTEGRTAQYDRSWDSVWQSRGRRTDEGFVVWIAVPFKSLRFPTAPEQTWGLIFVRWIPRSNESATWPHASTRIQGRINQAAAMTGIRDISPGRNIQLIPYGFLRSFRALDTRDPVAPRFVSDKAEVDGGLDAKFVLKDSFALDVAVNPDFSQVESDEPQVTINRRFEVFFPEKRPFFLEQPSYFETPINLFFSRRIADPQFGVRLTGKKGPYAIGALAADDEAPGKTVAPSDPVFGKRARFGIVRVSRDLGKESLVGAIYTDREFAGSTNRVGGGDARLKLSPKWIATLQGVASATQFLDGRRIAGPAYKAELRHEGRQLFSNFEFNDRSPGFFTETGFLTEEVVQRPLRGGRTIVRPPLRTDVRSVSQVVLYRFRPEGKRLISWGPNVVLNPIWDHSGTRLDMFQDYSLSVEMTGETMLELFYSADREVLRPQDFAGLPENRDFLRQRKGVFFETNLSHSFNFRGEFSRGNALNFVPPDGQEPSLARLTRSTATLLIRPINPLRVENTYLLERLGDRATGANVFNNHIARSKIGWQFSKELSLRVILQYNAILPNPQSTALERRKNFNADFLFTYLVNPWTALYIGYNGNRQNLELLTEPAGSQLRRTNNMLTDAKQFFVKFSYLVQF